MYFFVFYFFWPKIGVHVRRNGIEETSDEDEFVAHVETVDDDVIQQVNEHYNEADLFEWEPAPPPVSRPDEPGNLGVT